jgi:hypothetical protein
MFVVYDRLVDHRQKLVLTRAVQSNSIRWEKGERIAGALASHLHDYTHGLHSDPTTTLVIVFSAFMHDVDHRGISNGRLIEEDEQMANLYKNKSIADQNSLDISWDLLMSDNYTALRACMFAREDDLKRFRQVIVNVVLATDIFD